MKNKKTLLLLIVVAGLLMTIAVNRTQAQQPVDSRSATSGAKSQYVTINGAVSTPGRFELRENMRLSDLLTLAGSFTIQAEGTIRINHYIPEAQIERFDVYNIVDILAHGEPNPYLQPSDIVTVIEAKPVYVIGNVEFPGMILLRRGNTLSRVIAMTGWVRKGTRTDEIRIYRLTSGGTALNTITADLKAIKDRRAEDVELQPYDIIEVPSKNGYLKLPVFVKLNPDEIGGYKIRY
jgi:protein involved in polysaccharide export with SLBB domain